MNKIVAIGLFLLTYTAAIAQKGFEGTVVFGIEYKDLPAEMAAFEAMLPDETVIKIKGDMSRTEQSLGMGMKQVTVFDTKKNQGTLLLDMMGKKTAVEMNADQMEKQRGAKAKTPEIEYMDEDVKKIAGFKCKKAKVKVEGGAELELYYTDELPASASREFKGLKGFPLEYTIVSGPMKMKLTASAVKQETLDKKLFEIPDGYEKQSFEDFQKSMGAMMGGN
jgi:GLPGLI family protein